MRLEDITEFCCCSPASSYLGKKDKYKEKKMYITSGVSDLELEPQNRDRESTRVWLGMHAGARAQTHIAKVALGFKESLNNSILSISDWI